MRLSLKPTISLYLSSLLAFTCLSWVILLRDDWALKALVNFYPSLNPTIFDLQSWALSHHLNTIPTAFLFITLICLFIAYFNLIGLIKSGQLSTQKALITLSFSISILFLSYPILSTDVFDYILINRQLTIYHHNPWTTPSNTNPADPFINLGQWQRITSVYGPTHHLFTLPAAYLAGSGFLSNIISLRITSLVFLFTTAIVFYRLAGRLKLLEPLNQTFIFLFNPAVLLEFISSSHNDIIMIAFMLASFLAFARKQYLFSGLLLALGFGLKLFPVVLLPFFLAFLLGKRQFKPISHLILGFSITIAALLFIMGRDSIAAYLELMKWVFTLKLNSLPNLFNRLPDPYFTLPFIAFALYRVFINPKVAAFADLISEYSVLTLIYLLFVIPLYWPWYIIWIWPFALLAKRLWLKQAALALTFSSTLYYPLLMFSHRFNYTHPAWTWLIYLTIFLPPAFYLTRHLWLSRRLIH